MNEIEAGSAQGTTSPEPGFLVVGLGASAGGIPALSTFFRNVPADSGMAYVVILHLSPDHESRLASVLQTVASIPVRQVTDPVVVEPNHVYVVPPDRHLMLSESTLTAVANVSMEERRAPVDIFFRTLGDCMGARAACVVLSGTGANGSMGVKRVKERGGVVFVQQSADAQFDEVPRHSLATGLVDQVLPVASIPAALAGYQRRMHALRLADSGDERQQEIEEALREVFTHMRTRTGADFTNYKRPTLLRRIERRMNVRNAPDLAHYAALLREDAPESRCCATSSSPSRASSAMAPRGRISSARCSRSSCDRRDRSRPCASGARAAPPARRRTASRSCAPRRSSAGWTRPRCRSSLPTSTSARSP